MLDSVPMTELNPYAPPADDNVRAGDAAISVLGEPLALIHAEAVVAKRKRNRILELHRDALVLRTSGASPKLLLTRSDVAQTLTIAHTLTRYTLRFSGQPELTHQLTSDGARLFRAWLQPMPESVIRAAAQSRLWRLALFTLFVLLAGELFLTAGWPWVSTSFLV